MHTCMHAYLWTYRPTDLQTASQPGRHIHTELHSLYTLHIDKCSVLDPCRISRRRAFIKLLHICWLHRVTCWSQCCCRAICLLQWDQSLQHFFGAIFTSILASSLWWPPFRLPFDPLLSFVAGLVSFAKQASKTWDGHSSPRGSSWVLQMHPEMLATQALPLSCLSFLAGAKSSQLFHPV